MNSKKKVAVIGTVGLPANYGGFETLTSHLVDNLDQEFDFTVYCSGKKYKKESRQRNYKNARLVFLPFNANGIQSIIYDSISILHALFYADVLLILGVAGGWLLPFVKLFTSKKIIISIDGIEWKRDKWSLPAKWYLFWAEGLAVKHSHIDISDNESIQDYTALRYNSLSRIIEYGADHTVRITPNNQDRESFPFLYKPYAFKVCRIEPENNVKLILESFSALPKHILVLVGNWNNSEFGKTLRAQYASYKNIYMLDPIYNQRKLDVLRGNAFVYIHGHSAGGTNPSLVEAMYLGLPILSYRASYNRTTTENSAIYFSNSNELSNIINTSSFETLKAVGIKMQNIAQRRYTWSIITNKYKALILEALSSPGKSHVKAKMKDLSEETLIQMDLGHLKHQYNFYENTTN